MKLTQDRLSNFAMPAMLVAVACPGPICVLMEMQKVGPNPISAAC